MRTPTYRMRWVIAVAVGLLAFGAVGASASALGTVSTTKIGTSTSAVGACLSGATTVTVTWNGATFVAGTTPTYTVNSLTFGNYGTPCQSLHYQLTIANSGGVSQFASSGTVAVAATTTIAISPALDVRNAASVTLVIYP